MNGHARFAVAAAIFLLGSAAALGATRSWTGGTPGDPTCPPNPNPAWSDPCNWSGKVLPAPGDDLVFNGGPPSVNTFPDDQTVPTFNSITINGHAINGGNKIALNAGISGTGGQINLESITLNASQQFSATAANSGLTVLAPIITNGRTLTLAGAGGFVFVGPISGSGGIIKNGSGSLQFAGNHSYTGDTTINNGAVRIAGNHLGSRFVTFGFNALIGGAGTVKGLTASDPLDPGAANNGTGIFVVAGDLDITTNGSLQIDIKGTTPGTEFDQVQVTGAVDIDFISGSFGAGLNVELVGFTPAPGNKFVIITNDGTDPIANSFGPSGAFFGRPEGSTFTVPNSSGGNTTFFITYKGGDGNDVALHVPAVRTWDGGGSNNNWMTAANWVGDVAPAAGDSLVFPPSASRRMNTNNFPAGTKFNSISIDGSYNLGGNAIVLQAGIASTGNTGHSVNLGGIKLDANQSFTRDGQGDLNVSSSIDTNGKTLTLLSATDVGRQRYLLGGISGAGGINMAALNSVVFEASNTYTGPTVISSGNLSVRGTQPASPIQMSGGRLLGSLGVLGSLTATGGTINPFGSPATLGVSGNLSFNSAVTMRVSFARDPNGTATASMLDVAGAVNLGGSTLALDSFFAAPQTGDQVTIIKNDGTDPVVGTFASLPEGALFAFGNATMQISYQGGDGNDVVLHVTAVTPVGIGLVKLTNGTDNDAPPGPFVPVGSTVTFHYLVTNTASTPLEGVRVKDDNGTPGTPGDDFTLTAPSQGDTNNNDLLDPGETFTFSANRIATEGQYTNIAEARGSGVPFGPIVTASNSDNHFGGTPPSSSLANISTRLRVQGGDSALIGGVIVTGTTDKQVLIRAIGPTLTDFGLPGALPDPTLELFQGNQQIASNDDWVSSSQMTEISDSGLAPGKDAESAIIATLTPNQNYTAVVRGKDGLTGVGVVEVFDLDPTAPARLANISTRGFVDVDDNVMIAGLIVAPTGASNINVLVRALGPTLGDFGVQGFLANPTLDLVSSNGTVIRSNNDWKDSQRAAIEAAQLAPAHDAEAALIESLAPGAYTAVVRGLNRTTGVGLVEVYNIP